MGDRAVGDVVEANGSSYVAKNAISGYSDWPDQNTTDWGLIASIGATGATGPTGATGATGPAGSGSNYLGSWNEMTTYSENDVVTHNGSSWIYVYSTPGDSTEPGYFGAYTIWERIAFGFNYRGAWDSQINTLYTYGSVVTYNGSAWMAGYMILGAPGNEGSGWSLLASGPTGPTGPTGADGSISSTFQGAWDTNTTYADYDVVLHNGSTWMSYGGGNQGNEPFYSSNPMLSHWYSLALAGATGPTGVISAPASLTQESNNADYPLTISSANEQGGGAGWSDILKLINSKSGVTNPAKHIRMDATGGLEIVNDAYTQTIFSLTDSGVVTSSNLGDSGWISVSLFANSFSAVAAVAYRRLNNVVYLRGNVTGGTAGTGAFILPSGYRPSVSTVIPVQQYGTGNITYVTVGTDGVVVPNSTSGWLSSVVFPVG